MGLTEVTTHRRRDDPLISVLMAVRDGRSYLDDSLNSVLDQTESDLEFLVLDDGSEDGTLQRLREFARRDERVRIWYRSGGGHGGLTRSLNELLFRSRGQFIARMDADDVCLPDRFEQQLRFMGRHPTCVLAGGLIEHINRHGDSVACRPLPLDHDAIDGRHLWQSGGGIIHPTWFGRRGLFERLGGYRPQFPYAQDYDFMLRAAEVGELRNLKRVVLRYRIHDAQVSRGRRAEQLRCMGRALRDAGRRRHISAELRRRVRRYFLNAAVVACRGDQYRIAAGAAFQWMFSPLPVFSPRGNT